MRKAIVFLLFLAVIGGSIISESIVYAKEFISQSDQLRLLQEIYKDHNERLTISIKMSQIMSEWTSGEKTELEMWFAFADFNTDIKPLWERTTNRFESFHKNYPLDKALSETDTFLLYKKLDKQIGVSVGEVGNLLSAIHIGIERFMPREQELSKGEKKALEELITVYKTLSDVYGELLTPYPQ